MILTCILLTRLRSISLLTLEVIYLLSCKFSACVYSNLQPFSVRFIPLSRYKLILDTISSLYTCLAIPHVCTVGQWEKVRLISLTFYSFVNIGSWRCMLSICQLSWKVVSGSDMQGRWLNRYPLHRITYFLSYWESVAASPSSSNVEFLFTYNFNFIYDRYELWSIVWVACLLGSPMSYG